MRLILAMTMILFIIIVISILKLINSGVAFLTINSIKKSQNLLKFSTKKHKTLKEFHLTEEGWLRSKGKGEGEGGCGDIFH